MNKAFTANINDQVTARGYLDENDQLIMLEPEMGGGVDGVTFADVIVVNETDGIVSVSANTPFSIEEVWYPTSDYFAEVAAGESKTLKNMLFINGGVEGTEEPAAVIYITSLSSISYTTSGSIDTTQAIGEFNVTGNGSITVRSSDATV